MMRSEQFFHPQHPTALKINEKREYSAMHGPTTQLIGGRLASALRGPWAATAVELRYP